MIRSAAFLVVMYVFSAQMVGAEESLMNEFVKDFAGRWVSKSVADQDVEGYWKKGDNRRVAIVNTPTQDLSGVHYEWQVEIDGEVIGKAHGTTTWDSAKKCMHTLGFAVPGFHVESCRTKQGELWVENSVVTFPDGTKASSTNRIEISEDGKTHTDTVTDRVSHTGESIPDTTFVWKRVSESQEVLEKQLGWLVGSWTAKTDDPTNGAVVVDVTYSWAADKNAMLMDLKVVDFRSTSLIFFDASDGKIKMRTANSVGGNGLGTGTADGNEFTWNHKVARPDGKMTTSSVTYVKKSDTVMHVRLTDAVTGEQKEVPVTKK